MNRARVRLGDSTIPGFSADDGTGTVDTDTADNTSIDWNSVIEQGLQVVGQAINNQPIPTYRPTYVPTGAYSTSNGLLPLVLLGGVAFFIVRAKR